MGEADPSEILLVNKENKSARRLKDVEGIQFALESLGSAQNVTLTHLARTKKIIFTEGMDDYKIIRRFAQNLGFIELSSGSDLTAFESGGFSSWEKIKSFAWGVKKTIDTNMKLFAVYDRDYYCNEQLESILSDLKAELTNAHIHERKEIENYFLDITVLERVLDKQIANKKKRTGNEIEKTVTITTYLEDITNSQKANIQGQYIGKRLDYKPNKKIDSSTISKQAIESFELLWAELDSRMTIVPGKNTLRMLRDSVQRDYGVNLTDVQIIDEFRNEEIPDDLKSLIHKLEIFRVS